MEAVSQLTQFYSEAVGDERIGASHVCLYMALFQLWNLNGFKNPVVFKRAQLMKLAKINGRATYHKCMRQLQEYGYIQYIPSWDSGNGSKVYFES